MSHEANISSDPNGASGRGAGQQSDSAFTTSEFAAALDDADILLDYAAGNSQPKDAIPVEIVKDIVLARQAWQMGAVSSETAINFWLAYAKLSRLTKPVTGASVRECRTASLKGEKQWAMVLVIITTVASIFLFMNNTSATDTSNLIEQQNAAALKLWSDLQVLRAGDAGHLVEASNIPRTGTASDAAFANLVFEEAVEFSRRSQWLLQSANKLHSFNFWSEIKPPGTETDFRNSARNFECRPDHGARRATDTQISGAAQLCDGVVQDRCDLWCVDNLSSADGLRIARRIPVRLQAVIPLIRRKCYLPSAALSARYYIAIIAGLVVGLFGSLAPSNLVPSPLALAFLVGYAVEAFFSRLDDLIVKLKGDVPSMPGTPQEAAGGT